MKIFNFNKNKVGFGNKTVREYKVALKELKTNPNNHKFNKEEVDELLAMEKSFEELNKPNPEALAQKAEIEKRVRELVKNSEIFHKVITSQLKNLVSRGWYVSPTVINEISVSAVYQVTSKNNVADFEKYILLNFDTKVTKLLDGLSFAFPERKRIFDEMKQLYKNELYYSFINLCYAQTDGVCNDKWGQGFFNTDKNKGHSLTLPTKLGFEIESISDIVGQQLSEPRNEITIGSGSFDEQGKRSSFNRHLVLHGHSYNYGTKQNAIRALLLLEFTHWLTQQK